MGLPKPAEDHSWAIAQASLPQPEHLKGIALEEYNRIGPYLLALGRVSEIDYHPLVGYCLSWQSFARLMEDEFRDPWIELYEPGIAGEVPHSLLSPLLKHAKTTIHAAERFGMTARTRTLEGVARQAKSSAIKQLLGNQRKVAAHRLDRSIVPMMGDWEPEHVEPPEWMAPRARAEYLKLGKNLENMDLFTPLDRGPLVIGCCLFDLMVRANEQLKDPYTHYTIKSGEQFSKAHPLHSVLYEIYKVADIIWKDYGQSPMYRKLLGNEKKSVREIPMVFKGRFAK